MIYSVTGKIVYVDQYSVAVECGGVAFRCVCSLQTLKEIGGIGSSVTLFTHLSVREDGMELFGFSTPEELAFFKLLIGVNGVGPKAAVSILSQHTPASLALSISAGDIKAISRAQGIGAKIAQRVILELKDKIGDAVSAGETGAATASGIQTGFGGNVSEAVSALAALGFSASDAAKALSGADPHESTESLIRLGLKQLSKGF